MDKSSTIIGIVVAMVVGIIVAGSVLMPVLDDVTATEATFKNDGYFTYDAVTDDTDVTITWAVADPSNISVNGVSVAMPDAQSNWTIVGSENFTLRFYRNATVTGLQCYGTSGYISGNTGTAGLSTVSVTVSSSAMVVTAGETTRSYTMGTHGFVVNAKGDGALTLKYSNQSAYVMGDSEVYLCGTTFVTGSGTNDFVGLFGYGSLDDGMTMSAFYGNTGSNTVSFGDVTATYSSVNGYDGLYLLEKFTFPLTQNSATVTAIYSYFVVPTEVTAEKSVHLNDGEISMLMVVPLLIIVGILMLAVRMMVYRD